MTLNAPIENHPNLFRLDGRVAIVTGAGRGIGRACALLLAEYGADVAIVSRTLSDLRSVADDVHRLGRGAVALEGDVQDESVLNSLVAQTVDAFHRIDILINNAGGTGPNDPLTMSPEDFLSVLRWNVMPAYTLIQKTIPYLKNSKNPSIVNISSISGTLTQPHFTAYGAAKSALNRLTQNIAQDIAPVRVNAIAPNAIETPTLERFLTRDRKRRMLRMTPLGRLGHPLDVAAAAVFLSSDAASWITGKVIQIDGGAETPYF